MVRCLRGLLWLALAALAALAAAAGYGALQPQPDELRTPDLPVVAWDQVLLLLAAPVVMLTCVPLLLALRGGRAGWGRAGLASTSLLLAAVAFAVFGDLRARPVCDELGNFGPLVAPAWLAAVLFLATSRAGRTALGLGPSRAVARLHLLLIALLAASLAGDGLCLACARRPYAAALGALRPGQSWSEVWARLAPSCAIRATAGEWMEAECRPVGPPACLCAPTWTRRARLDFDAQARLVSWRLSTGLGGLDARGR